MSKENGWIGIENGAIIRVSWSSSGGVDVGLGFLL
jgi:hypothetical protein